MKKKFTKKIAKEIAYKQFDETLDCVLGRQDQSFGLDEITTEHDYGIIQNFEESLEEININPTPKRIEEVIKQYNFLVNKAIKIIEKLYFK